MAEKKPTCKVCGAVANCDSKSQITICVFCGFEHHEQKITEQPISPNKALGSLAFDKIYHAIAKLSSARTIHTEGLQPHISNQIEHIPFTIECSGVNVLISENQLPFVADVNDYFRERYLRLTKGGLWYLSTPVSRPLQNTPPYDGQVNFFKSKNIMFLLEQHGFKMAWRQNRFSPTLRLIARKN